MTFLKQTMVLILMFALFLNTGVSFAEKVGGATVVISSKPNNRKHCKVYSSKVTSKFNNPAIEKEIKDIDKVAWELTHQAEFRENNQINYTSVDSGGYSILYDPARVTGTLSPQWTIFECEKTKTISGKPASGGTK